MENALLIGLSRQIALAHQMDVVANNMANLNTPGYKGESLKFEEFVMPVAEFQDMGTPTKSVSYVLDARVVRNFVEGPLNSTGNPSRCRHLRFRLVRHPDPRRRALHPRRTFHPQ